MGTEKKGLYRKCSLRLYRLNYFLSIFYFYFILFYFFILGLNEKREREKEMICVES